jgi:hypothetical protein
VFAARLDALDGPPVNWRVHVNAGQGGKDRFESCHRATRQGTMQRAGGAVDGVAFRHQRNAVEAFQ